MTSPLEPRLAAIERAIALLSAEVARIRADMGGTAGDANASPAAVPAPNASQTRRDPPDAGRLHAIPTSHPLRPRIPAPTLDSAQLENLVGQYGMLALAVLAIVAMVGTFLRWAIGHGYLTLSPGARVILGIAFAAGLAVWGLRLRRTERSFGSSIVGLALVVLQVCAYAAGPSFRLVPTSIAFVGAAAASWALALFAHREDDEPLWCVGFGGAALAPFVTSDGRGSVYTLAGYSALVLLPACFAISHRNWRIAWRVFYLASALLVLAAAMKAHVAETTGYVIALALPFVVMGAGIVPFAPDSRKRGALRWLGVLAGLTTLAEAVTFDPPLVVIGASVLSIALWLVLVDRHADIPQSSMFERFRDSAGDLDWLDGAVVPMMLAMPPAIAFEVSARAVPAYAAAAVIGAAFSWRRSLGSLRDASAFAAMMFAGAAVVALSLQPTTANVAAFIVLGWLGLAAHRSRPSLSWLTTGGSVLVLAAGLASVALLRRTAYQFMPFATEPSLAGLVALVGFAVPSRFASALGEATSRANAGRSTTIDDKSLKTPATWVSAAAWVWTFLWVVMELSMAFSRSTSILLLVAWYAATAVACVGAGRARGSARLRQVGLALGVVAAATAFYGAQSYFGVGVRILAYLITSAFLLGIAYWYRRPGSRAARAEPSRLDADHDRMV